jgi:hypothetical protein
MSHEQVLENAVARIQTRIRLLRAQGWLLVGLTYALAASLILVAATRFRWWTDAVDYLWAVLLVGAVTGAIIGFTRRITPLTAAQIADERGGLKDRLTTAISLPANESRSELAGAQLADAAAHAASLEPARILPWKMPPQWRWAAAAAAVLAGVIFIPDLPVFQSPQERADREVMKREGVEIQKIAKTIEKTLPKKSGSEDEEAAKKIARNMKALGHDQEKGRISKKQAMLKMNELQKELKELDNQRTPSGGGQQKPMDNVTADMRDAAGKHERAGKQELARSLRQMADNLDKKDFDGAKRQLQELAKKMADGKMSQQEAQDTAEMLQQMAQSMEGSNMDSASKEVKQAAQELKKAADAAKKFQQQMASAKTDAERQQLQQQAQNALNQGMQQAGQTTHKAGGT